MELRYYQDEAIGATMDYWAGGGGNPLIDMATGTGKSIVIAGTAKQLMGDFPGFKILCLTHKKELIEQNAKALLRNWPGAPIGINSAGIGRRDTSSKILFAGIQSVYLKPDLLGPRDLVMIDEAHLVPKVGLGMYKSLLDALLIRQPDMRVVGYTATPFRLDSGRLDDGPDKLFDKTVYNYSIQQGIDDGFLCPPVSRAMASEVDVSKVARRGGEFVEGALAAAIDQEDLVNAAADEIVMHGENRRSWLVFCAGINHANNVAEALRARGISCGAITSETPAGDRTRMIQDFQAGKLRALTNAMVLTTGFDCPPLDMIAMLRPTLSTSLYIQIIGRGTRISPETGKTYCLILDFAGNVRRHGPVDDVNPKGSKNGVAEEDDERAVVGVNDVRAKECPNCHTLSALQTRTCPTCSYVFADEAPKHDATPDLDCALLARDKDPWEPVRGTEFFKHSKAGGLTSMRVEYQVGMKFHREWICFEHTGHARDRAVSWWNRLGGEFPTPSTIDEALNRTHELHRVTHIKLKPNGQYYEVVGRKLDLNAYFPSKEMPARAVGDFGVKFNARRQSEELDAAAI